MALLKCPECGEAISSNAKTCPHCGCEITVCPDCNSVFTAQPDRCPNCGHAFNDATRNATHSEKQTAEDELKYYIKGKLSLFKGVRIAAQILNVVSVILLVAPYMILISLPQNDPIEYIDALLRVPQTLQTLTVCFAVVTFIFTSSDVIADWRCNLLYTITANEMSLNDIDGVKYCKEHQTSLNSVNKKANEWTFALNAAYRQDNRSTFKFNIIYIVICMIFVVIQTVCIAVCFYQVYDNLIYCLVYDVKFEFFKSINYIAAGIWLAAVVALIIIQTKLQNKYTKNLKAWCGSKSLPINFK